MNLLLDTHAFLWAVMEPEKLSPKIRRLLESSETGVFVSTASAWEISIKYRLGRLPDAAEIVRHYDDVTRELRAEPLLIKSAHALMAGSFPQAHRDPFDRMLAAQAKIEGLMLASKDRALHQFGVQLLW